MKNILKRRLLPFIIASLGVIYGLWPLDAIPDIPVIGWIDDFGVLGTTFLIAIIVYFKNRKEENDKK